MGGGRPSDRPACLNATINHASSPTPEAERENENETLQRQTDVYRAQMQDLRTISEEQHDANASLSSKSSRDAAKKVWKASAKKLHR